MRCLPPLLLLALPACKVKEPPPRDDPFADRFERAVLGPDYRVTGDGYAVVNGALSARGAHNHPLWLRRAIPRDVRIEFDAWSTERRGDLKVELFGDGASFDPDGGGYRATGYELIFGGWYNTRSMIARLDEHGAEHSQRTDRKVVPNQRYHWRIERKGKHLTWFIDDMTSPFLEYEDATPLEGEGHDHFAFNNWETDTWFDNLSIQPL